MTPDDLDLLRTIAPENDHAAALFTAPEREALFATAIAAPRPGRSAAARHPARTWAYRLAPVAAAGTAAAVALTTSGGAPGPAKPAPAAARTQPSAAARTQPPAAVRRQAPAAAGIRTVGYVISRTDAALTAHNSGMVRVTYTYPDGVSRDIEDLASGASRSTFTEPDGAIAEDDSVTGTGATAITTIVDYRIRAWWTIKNENGSDIAGITGPTLRQQLAGKALAIVGNDSVDGQPAIHLRYTSRLFTVGGKQYYSDTSDIWVNATSFLPIREIGSNNQWTADLTWSLRPPTAAQLTAVAPAGFTHRDGPPPAPPQPGGLG